MVSTQEAKSEVILSSFGGVVRNNFVKSQKLSDFFAAGSARAVIFYSKYYGFHYKPN
jgi:hypothetical protein